MRLYKTRKRVIRRRGKNHMFANLLKKPPEKPIDKLNIDEKLRDVKSVVALYLAGKITEQEYADAIEKETGRRISVITPREST